MTKHVHHDLIVQWANGATIQFKDSSGQWFDSSENSPEWTSSTIYRVKPRPVIVSLNMLWLEGGGIVLSERGASNMVAEFDGTSHKLLSVTKL